MIHERWQAKSVLVPFTAFQEPAAVGHPLHVDVA